jgi:membrane-associated phospholipid phosphatase
MKEHSTHLYCGDPLFNRIREVNSLQRATGSKAMKFNITTVRGSLCRATVLVFIAVVTSSGFGRPSAYPTPEPEQTPIVTPAPQASPTPQPLPTPQASPTTSRKEHFFRNLAHDQQAIWTAPFRLSGDDVRWLAPLAATTAGLIATDRRTAGALDDDGGRLAISRGVSFAGSIYATGGLAAGFYLVGRKTDNARARETGFLGAEALVNTVIVYQVLKAVTQRPRPREAGGHGRFFDGGRAFPSGHAANAWALATIVAEEYHDRPLVRYGAYSLATAVSLSRFSGRRHFLSDVFIGSAIGFGIGRYVYRQHHDPNLDHPRSRTGRLELRSNLFPSIAPYFSRSDRRRAPDIGARLVWTF